MGDIKVTIVDNNCDLFKNAAQDAIERALETIGLVAEGYAKRLCPVDTGRLRNSISHARDESSAYIGTNVEYAPYVELGTRRMRAKPFLRPAVENYSAQYRQIVEDTLKNA